jgi:hypothetical protein
LKERGVLEMPEARPHQETEGAAVISDKGMVLKLCETSRNVRFWLSEK